ncbi:MAG: antitoxin HicB [Candidatus Nealsonbacteria bacterium RIFCSPLOWO2_01_FULL_43_32]|uniref:Antitoxin HicB n=1 Tax=Candidatus Nealsonbacteria bacterium RIFCSPLOWO2_01_FULL_43_32 TaxID=1801672 RepID=A0A1G2EEM0_9BACT|nr:MAG: antitoxin HicB [Candidatus Nealsonbacteria bacterium RIFCSPLOWO2_01_FULL_43_32]
MKNILHYNVIFRPEREGGFTVVVPSLPGCVTYGKSLKEAKKMVADAIEGYIASLKKHKEPIPTDEENFFTSVDIKKNLVHA